jgi:hypothetical protein
LWDLVRPTNHEPEAFGLRFELQGEIHLLKKGSG